MNEKWQKMKPNSTKRIKNFKQWNSNSNKWIKSFLKNWIEIDIKWNSNQNKSNKWTEIEINE